MQTKPPDGTLTPEHIRHLGYTPIPVHPDTRAIARRWAPGLDIDTPAGLLADGTYLHLLDLDSHSPDQDASAQLVRIRRRLGPDLASRLAIRRSRSERGYHIVYRTATLHSPHAFIKVFDPLQPNRHIGELIGPGQRVTLTGEWIQHGPDAIPLLTAKERDLLCAAIHTPALYAPQNTPGSPQSDPGSHTARKARMAEGLDLIAGWEHVTDVQHRLDILAQHKEQVEQHLREMHRTPEDRSDAYCHLVQCLMYHARDLGRDLAERCRVVAALAIHVGAAGKERERTYKIVTDTATLIARILHGDAFLNNPDLHFGIPRWVNAEHIPPRPAAPTRAQPAPRTPSQLADDRQRNITRMLRYLRKLPSDECGKRYTSTDDLAEHLRVSRRTISSYLSELRKRKAILTGQDGGNGPLFILICEPPKATHNLRRHAGLPKDEPQATPENSTDRHADQSTELPALMPESSSKNRVCIEVLGAPKPCSPVPLAPADEQIEVAGASFEPLAGDLAVSYELPDDLGSDLAVVAGSDTRPSADDQAKTSGASFVPLPDDQAGCYELADDLAEIAGAGNGSRADDLADLAGANFVPLADDQAVSYEAPDDLAEIAGASYEPLAEDLADAAGSDTRPSADDQAKTAGASFVPLPDDQAEAAGDISTDDQAEAAGASYDPALDQIAAAAEKSASRRRKGKDPIRKKLDDARQQVESWRAMSLPELERERFKLDGASQDCKRPPQQRELFRKMVSGIDYEIGRKRSAGIQAMYQAANAPIVPPASEQAAPVAGIVRRSWRSPVVRADWDTPPALVLPALPAPCVPELAAEGWACECAGSAWRAVHPAGYMTALYINPEAARRAVERRDYHPVAS